VQKLIRCLWRRDFGRWRGASAAHTPPVGLSGASHEASGQKIKPEMPKLFLPGPLARFPARIPKGFRFRAQDCHHQSKNPKIHQPRHPQPSTLNRPRVRVSRLHRIAPKPPFVLAANKPAFPTCAIIVTWMRQCSSGRRDDGLQEHRLRPCGPVVSLSVVSSSCPCGSQPRL